MIFLPGALTRKSKLAFDGHLYCPVCKQSEEEKGRMYDPRKQRWHLDRYITPFLIRYICKKCKTPVRYDISQKMYGGQKASGRELNILGLKT